jgi:MFS family permease
LCLIHFDISDEGIKGPSGFGEEISGHLHMSRNASEFSLGWKVVMAAALGVGIGVSGAPFYTLGVFLKPLSGEFGWSRAEASAATLFLTFGSALTAPVVGRLADRLNVRKIALISLIGIVLAFLWLTQSGPRVGSWYFGLALLALAGCGTTPLVWVHAVTTWFDKSRGLALGCTLAGSGISGIVSPHAVDFLIMHYGWRAGYVGLALFTMVVALPVVFLFFREKATTKTAKDTSHLPGLTVGEVLRTRRYWQLAIGFLSTGGAIAACRAPPRPRSPDFWALPWCSVGSPSASWSIVCMRPMSRRFC